MSRPIDADVLAEIFADRMEIISERYGFYSSEAGILSGAYKLLQSQPTIEPEIIHCEDCKHYNAGFECLIEGYGIKRNKDWFCGDAERRQDDTYDRN